ncbi:DUF169 domain-containing protein [Methanothermobacter sp.]|uniref:DUF169 domain-containing protein n=1 Tax=Methanothermobacter sp. TaxID=1884223 RepID=UPI003C783732
MSILDLSASPVGVKFHEKVPENAVILKKHRYCQALMRARRGEVVVLPGDEITCPAAARALGFSELPEKLKTGKGLVGFGIVEEEETGAQMFQDMPELKWRGRSILLYPLDRHDEKPDVVVVEDQPEKLMWIALAYLNLMGGRRINSSTAVLQAVCVDATIIPYLNSGFNISLGCYGCRDATDIGTEDALVGFHGDMLPEIVKKLKYLYKRAIPRSRAKNALKNLRGD